MESIQLLPNLVFCHSDRSQSQLGNSRLLYCLRESSTRGMRAANEIYWLPVIRPITAGTAETASQCHSRILND